MAECAPSLKGGAVKDSPPTPVPGLGLLFEYYSPNPEVPSFLSLSN